MSVDTSLDSSFTLLLAKARSGLGTPGAVATPTTTPTATLRSATMHFEWGGGGAVLVQSSCDPIVTETPFPCRIAWAHLRTGDAAGNPVSVNAQIDVELSQFETFGGRTPLSASGTPPTLSGSSKSNVSLSGWKIDLSTGDTITARVATYSGSATWISLIFLLQPTEVQLANLSVVDGSGNQLVDSNGNRLVLRG